MRVKGSITVFVSLILAVMISLISGLLLSAKVSAGRVQIANGVDLSLFSMMAKYDRQLFEEYHLLYIDGGYGTESLQLGKAIDEIESDLVYSLTPNKGKEWLGGRNFLQLDSVSGSIVGYTLATDCDGGVFWEQVVSYMEDTLSLQGISFLSQNMEEIKSHFSRAEVTHKEVEGKGTVEDYAEIKQMAEERTPDESKEDDMENVVTEAQKAEAVRAQDVLEGISQIKKNSVMHLVVPDVSELSGWSASRKDLYRYRELSSGMGYLELVREDQVWDNLLFREYILQNINCFTNKKHETGPAYGVEWILFEKLSDVENLQVMINRLLTMREMVNVAYLYTDSNRLAEIRVLASSLAAVLGMPGAEIVIEGALALSWAYVESMVDVHTLLSGKRVPVVKSFDTWQVDFSEILLAIQNPESFSTEAEGMSYKDYLRLLLAAKEKEACIAGCMEVIEESMRELPGKEMFSMDHAIDAIEVEFEIAAERFLNYKMKEKRSYRTM